jgi:KDO2-lipid IV(A) lauroyltransferase
MVGYFIYLLLKGFGFLINLFPERIALWMGRQLGNMMYYLDWKHRRIAFKNLHIAFGREKSEKEMRAIAKASLQNVGMMVIEFFRIPGMDPKAYKEKVSFEGLEEALKLLGKKKGGLLLVGHFGNWELMGFISKVIGHPILAIAKPAKQKRIDRWMIEIRNAAGLEIIPPDDARRKVLKALSQNKLVAILIDQRAKRRRGVWVDFFGKKAPTTKGLAFLAMRSGAPVIPVFMIRNGYPKHRLMIKEPVELIRTGNIAKDVEVNTQRFTHILESMVRQYPEHWLWIHRRWERKKVNQRAKH